MTSELGSSRTAPLPGPSPSPASVTVCPLGVGGSRGGYRPTDEQVLQMGIGGNRRVCRAHATKRPPRGARPRRASSEHSPS